MSTADAQRFIDEYWRKRGESFRKEVQSRIEFADKQFALGKISGAKTEMGRVWMLLGTPNEVKNDRGGVDGGGANSLEGAVNAPRSQDSALERGARLRQTWLYRKDRLKPELGLAELKVIFQTDVSRSNQTIENVGQVEPYLRKAAGVMTSAAAATLASIPTRQPNVAKPAAPTADPLWGSTPNLNGAIFTGDAFVSPRDTPFYAVNLFIPNDAAAFKDWKSGLLVTLVRDSMGNQIVSERQPVDLSAYDEAGNRYVDRSFALAPGKYEAVVALYSPDGGTMLSSHREQFEVIAPNAASTSRLFLTSNVRELEKQDALDPFTFVATKYAIRGDRRFKVSDKISFFTVINNPTGAQPNLMQKMTFMKDGKQFFKSPLEPAQPTQTGPNSYLLQIAFDPATFKPGRYTLEYQVRDFNAPEGSEARTKGYVLTTDFLVEQ